MMEEAQCSPKNRVRLLQLYSSDLVVRSAGREKEVEKGWMMLD
jgi:hypothetical protein